MCFGLGANTLLAHTGGGGVLTKLLKMLRICCGRGGVCFVFIGWASPQPHFPFHFGLSFGHRNFWFALLCRHHSIVLLCDAEKPLQSEGYHSVKEITLGLSTQSKYQVGTFNSWFRLSSQAKYFEHKMSFQDAFSLVFELRVIFSWKCPRYLFNGKDLERESVTEKFHRWTT